MEITAGLVKELREKTGLAMMDCKKALVENNGDIEKSIEFLRKKGALKAESKSDRATSEGVIAVYIGNNGQLASMVEVNCETDFVARNDDFVALVKDSAQKATTVSSLEELAALKDADVKATIAKLGENMSIKRFESIKTESNGLVGAYVHSNNKVGVLVELTADGDISGSSEELSVVAKDIAMHVTASNPLYVNRDGVPAEFISKEKEIILAQSGDDLAKKPENIREKIMGGRLDKVYTQVCLLEQPFVKNPDLTVDQLLKETSKKVGKNVEVKKFVKYTLGA
ncbi:MAG: translation elongation factor Ts [Candidatus Sericytochromatia bacterium]